MGYKLNSYGIINLLYYLKNTWPEMDWITYFFLTSIFQTNHIQPQKHPVHLLTTYIHRTYLVKHNLNNNCILLNLLFYAD